MRRRQGSGGSRRRHQEEGCGRGQDQGRSRTAAVSGLARKALSQGCGAALQLGPNLTTYIASREEGSHDQDHRPGALFRRRRRPAMITRRLLLLTMAGCLSACDGAASIKGSVADERDAPYRDCRLELLLPDSGQVLDERPVPPEFTATFVIAPWPAVYRLRIACKESDEALTSEPKLLGREASFPSPLDLGNVRLKRRAK